MQDIFSNGTRVPQSKLFAYIQELLKQNKELKEKIKEMENSPARVELYPGGFKNLINAKDKI